MPSDKHSERVLAGRIGAYTVHSRYDSREITKAGREAFWSKFERQVDPDGLLDPIERARRADMARKAYFSKLALASAKARAKKRHLRESRVSQQVVNQREVRLDG